MIKMETAQLTRLRLCRMHCFPQRDLWHGWRATWQSTRFRPLREILQILHRFQLDWYHGKAEVDDAHHAPWRHVYEGLVVQAIEGMRIDGQHTGGASINVSTSAGA